MPEWLCNEAAQACQHEPGEEDQGDGDFISVKLGQELPDGEELDSN